MKESHRYNPEILSEKYSVSVYRNPETLVKEKIMHDFLYHVEYEFDMSQDEMDNLKALIVDYLGYDIKKVEYGEKNMLEKWIKGAKNE